MSPEFSSEGRLPPCVVVAAHLDGLSGGKAVAYDRSRPGQGRRVSERSDWCGAARGGQPVPDGVPVDAQLVGDPWERPRLLGNAVNQVGVQAGEAELGCAGGQVLVGGAAALVGGAEPPGWWGQAGVVEQAAGNHGGGGELAGQLCEGGVLLAAGGEVAGKVGEPQGDDAVVEAPLLAVDDRKAAAEDQTAGWWC